MRSCRLRCSLRLKVQSHLVQRIDPGREAGRRSFESSLLLDLESDILAAQSNRVILLWNSSKVLSIIKLVGVQADLNEVYLCD